jgi:Cu2+-exporting ATPase
MVGNAISNGASRALHSLVALLPSIVHIERNGSVTDISLQELKKDDVALIKPGEKNSR